MSAVAEPIAAATRVVPLIEAVELNPRAERAALSDDLEVSFVPMAAVEAGSGRMDATAVRRFGDVKKGYTTFREGDVLFAKITPCMENGKMAVARGLRNGVGCGSTEFHVLRPRPGVDAHYVYHFVSSASFRGEAAHHMTGAVGQKRVPVAFLERCEIPLPDLDEQRRIVAEIEKQFSRLDEAVANLKRVKANVKRYKAGILKAAVEGRLVPIEAEIARREGRSYEAGNALVVRILGERRRHWAGKGKYKEPAAIDMTELPTLPVGWTWTSLDSLSWDSGYGTSAKCTRENRGVPVLRIPNVQNAAIDLGDLKFAPPDFPLSLKDQVSEGDMLIIRTNGSKALIGRAAIVTDTPATPLTFASYLIRFRLCGEGQIARWVNTVWAESRLRTWLEFHAATSAGQHNISQSVLATAAIPVPPLAEQSRIVTEVERTLSLADALEREADRALLQSAALRNAVLAKTFV